MMTTFEKLEWNLARRRLLFDRYNEYFAKWTDRFVLPRQLEQLDTTWLGYPVVIRRDAGFGRPSLQRFLDERGIDTRTIWTGNAARQPMLAGRQVVVPEGGLPNADLVMALGVMLPLNHSINDETFAFVLGQLDEFLTS